MTTLASHPNDDPLAATTDDHAPHLEYWYSPGSCSLAGHILLHRSQLAFTSHHVPRTHSANSLPASYSLINPRKLIPSLRGLPSAPQEVITELPAILITVSYLSHHPHWVEGIHRSPLQRARIYEWLNFLSGHIHSAAFAAFFRPYRFASDDESRQNVRRKAVGTVEDALDQIEQRIAQDGPTWMVDGAFSVVDPMVYLFARWAELVEKGMAGRFVRLRRFAAWMEESDETRKALQSEGVEPFFTAKA